VTLPPSSPGVVEKRLDGAERFYEGWRCLMAVMVGACLTLALYAVYESVSELYDFSLGNPLVKWQISPAAWLEHTLPHASLLSIVLPVFLGVWGLSQIRPSLVILGTAVLALSSTTFFASRLLGYWQLSPLYLASFFVGSFIVFVPFFSLAIRVARGSRKERTLVAVSQGDTLGLKSAFQAVIGLHPVCRYLPSRMRRLLSSSLFAVDQLLLGITVFIIAWFVGVLLPVLIQLARANQPETYTNINFLIGELFVLPVVFIPFAALALGLRYLARRFSRTSLELMIREDSRAPILFLRSFKDDQVRLDRAKRNVVAFLVLWGEPRPTLDHVLLEEGTAQGPVIAIGAPGTTVPFGAARAYLSHDNWTEVVSDLALRSQVIVIALDETAGIKWEFNEVHGKGYTSKVLHLLPPRLTPPEAARSAVAEVCTASAELAQLFDTLQQFLAVNERCCIGWYLAPDAQLNVLTTARPNETSYRVAVRDYLRSNKVALAEERIVDGKVSRNRLGFAAFLLAVSAFLYDYLVSEIFVAISVFDLPEYVDMEKHLTKAAGFLNLLLVGEALMWLGAVAAIVLGIVGALGRSSRGLSLLAAVLGVVSLLLLSTLVVHTLETSYKLDHWNDYCVRHVCAQAPPPSH
jgi:hypothetical protein